VHSRGEKGYTPLHSLAANKENRTLMAEEQLELERYVINRPPTSSHLYDVMSTVEALLAAGRTGQPKVRD